MEAHNINEHLEKFFSDEPRILAQGNALVAYINNCPPEQTTLSHEELTRALPGAAFDEILRVLVILCDSPFPLIKPKWVFIDPITKKEYVLSMTEAKPVMTENALVHPETQQSVPDAGQHVFLTFRLLKADPVPDHKQPGSESQQQ